MKNILKITGILIFLTIVTSCQNKASQQNDPHNEESAEQEEAASKVALQLKQIEVMNIELGSISQINLGASLKVNGQLELPPQNRASVSAIIGGRVQSVAVIEGDYVKKGQVIAQLNNPEIINMQSEYLSAKSNITFLEKDFQRKKELLKDGITSQKSFQETEANYSKGKAELNSSKATLQLMGINVAKLEQGAISSSIPVIAPINGYVQKIEINIGKSVGPEQEMFEIIDNEYLHLGLNVFEKDIDKIEVGQKITFSLTTRPDKIYEAEIFALGKAFDMDTRSVKVHANIADKKEGLLTGMFVEARIATSNKTVNALPDEAFINEKGLDYIFIQVEKDGDDVVLERVQVTRGMSDLGFSEVLFTKNQPKNLIVVTKGAYYVNSELNKGEFGEHDH